MLGDGASDDVSARAIAAAAAADAPVREAREHVRGLLDALVGARERAVARQPEVTRQERPELRIVGAQVFRGVEALEPGVHVDAGVQLEEDVDRLREVLPDVAGGVVLPVRSCRSIRSPSGHLPPGLPPLVVVVQDPVLVEPAQTVRVHEMRELVEHDAEGVLRILADERPLTGEVLLGHHGDGAVPDPPVCLGHPAEAQVTGVRRPGAHAGVGPTLSG